MIPALVPRRQDHGTRDRIWDMLRERYWSALPYDVVEGQHDLGPFSRAAALNAAADGAGDWDLAVIADADTYVDPGQLTAAVELARVSGRLVMAYDRWLGMSAADTEVVLARGGLFEPRLPAERRPTAVSGMLVVPRAVWDAVDGFDEGFRGWGLEDVAFAHACRLAAGGVQSVPGPAWHLAHEPAPRIDALLGVSLRRAARYQRAATLEQVLAIRAS